MEANERDEEGSNKEMKQEVSKSGSFNRSEEEDDECDDFDIQHEESVDH